MAFRSILCLVLLGVLQAQSSFIFERENSLLGKFMPSILPLPFKQQPQSNDNQLNKLINERKTAAAIIEHELSKSVRAMEGKIHPEKVQQLKYQIASLSESYCNKLDGAKSVNDLNQIGAAHDRLVQPLQAEVQELDEAILIATQNTKLFQTLLLNGINKLDGRIPPQESQDMRAEVQRITDLFLASMKECKTGPQLDEARAASMPAVLALDALISQKTMHIGAVKMGIAQAEMLNENIRNSFNSLRGKIEPERIGELENEVNASFAELRHSLQTGFDTDAMVARLKERIFKVKEDFVALQQEVVRRGL